jgi:hypothetical protein
MNISNIKTIKMKKLKIIGMILIAMIFGVNTGCNKSKSGMTSIPGTITLSKETLQDKIKGGWAGQTLGVTYGGPTEFRYNSKIIADSIKIPWPDSLYCKWWFDNRPGLYDDIYMDLTFVEVFEKYGLDAPVDSFALAFANAKYPLWHANQAARYNILNGIMPPASGYWKNNPHSDDIDFQIEADYAGLMSPGMPLTASQVSDKIGHIMNYGDGWYGGVYVSAMYSLAFITSDIDFIVREALKMLPQESEFYKFMSDVITLSEQNKDWKQTWQEVEKKWGNDVTCPDGYSNPFNIEAKMNCAYIIMGLLYGDGDMGKTVDIATRCGADSDCNPSNAAGILGTALGYSKIADVWLNNVKEVEDIKFPYTNLSLNETYKASFKHALEIIQRNGGTVNKKDVVIKCQNPSPVRFEKSFEGIAPVKNEAIRQPLTAKTFEYKFEGDGILISGNIGNQYGPAGRTPNPYVGDIDVLIDGKLVESVKFPADFHSRKLEIYWNFDLSPGNHNIELKLKNPDKDNTIMLNYVIVYAKQ